MLETKVFEIFDRATQMTLVATKLMPLSQGEAVEYVGELKILGKSGLGREHSYPVMTTVFRGGGSADTILDVFVEEFEARTHIVAHEFISMFFDELKNCIAVDVEYLLGETKNPKTPELGIYLFHDDEKRKKWKDKSVFFKS